MDNFDLTKTSLIFDLCKIAKDQRQEDWKEKFYQAIGEASMSAGDPQVVVGPDGFPYFALNLPPVAEKFEPFSIVHLMDYCLDNGFGVVVNLNKGDPDWVFSYGDIWCKKFFGNFESPSSQPKLQNVVSKEREVIVGAPSEEYFPQIVREVVKDFFAQRFNNNQPKVLLMNDSQDGNGLSLVFSIFREEFLNEEEFSQVLYQLTWFFPRHYVITSINKDSEIVKDLRDF